MRSSKSHDGAEGRPAGFTLVELLVVVLILGVLLAVALPLYLQAYRNSVTKPVKENLRTIAVAAHTYKFRTGSYPAKYDNDGMNAALPPGNFIGPGLDLEAMPFGPHNVWYKWYISTTSGSKHEGHFVVQANEGGENLWGGTGSTASTAMFDLQLNDFYVQNGAAFK